MNREAEKSRRERVVFKAFIKASRLPIDPESVESCTPPKPDIVCFHNSEGHIGFELVEICAEDLARKLPAIRMGEESGFLRSRDPSWAILKINYRNDMKRNIRLSFFAMSAGRFHRTIKFSRQYGPC